ncbi:MAG: DUF4401 domain-containing protein [Proteobacteria bacterium]|nr:DUF4401 domain-containing protein [Pseudomonadota bacterium]
MKQLNANSIWESLMKAKLVEGVMPALTDNVTPWYIRIMLGAGGFIGALFLLGFVGAGIAFIFKSSGFSIFFGVTLCVAAAAIFSKKTDNDFASQFAFTLSLAGQALLIYGLAKLLPSSERLIASCIILIQCGLFYLIASFQHRVFSTIVGLYALIYVFNSYGLYLYTYIILFVACAAVWLQEFKYPEYAKHLRAVGYGSVIVLYFYLISGGSIWISRLLKRGLDSHSLLLSGEWSIWLCQGLIGVVMIGCVITFKT